MASWCDCDSLWDFSKNSLVLVPPPLPLPLPPPLLLYGLVFSKNSSGVFRHADDWCGCCCCCWMDVCKPIGGELKIEPPPALPLGECKDTDCGLGVWLWTSYINNKEYKNLEFKCQMQIQLNEMGVIIVVRQKKTKKKQNQTIHTWICRPLLKMSRWSAAYAESYSCGDILFCGECSPLPCVLVGDVE